MMSKLLTCVAFVAVVLCSGAAFAQDPPEDPFGGGIMINQDAEIFGLGAQNDSLRG